MNLENLINVFSDYQLSALAQSAGFMMACIIMVLAHVRAIYETYRDWEGRPGWSQTDRVRVNVALGTIFVSGLGSRTIALLLLQLRSHGYDTRWIEDLGLNLLWVSLFTLGTVCYVRVIARNATEWLIAASAIFLFIFLNVAVHGDGRAVL